MHRRSFLLAALASVPSAAAEDWPIWRGPRGDGTWQGADLPERWVLKELTPTWTRPVGGGYSGIAAVGRAIYTLDRRKLAEKTAGLADAAERIFALDANTGELLWQQEYPVTYGDQGGYGNGPRSMPTVVADRVYTFGAAGHLTCLETATGKIVWQHDCVRKWQARVPTWSFAASPLIDQDRLVVSVGAEEDRSVLCLDRHTGELLWGSLSDPAGYGPPLKVTTADTDLYIVWTPEQIAALRAEDGKQLWGIPRKITNGVAITPPVYHEGLLLVSDYWDGALALRLGPRPEEVTEAWRNRRDLRALMAQPLVRGDYVYLLDRGRGLTCAEWRTGRKIWDDAFQSTPKGTNPHASMVWVGSSDRLLMVNAAGELILAQVSDAGYRELARTRLTESAVWSHPAFTTHNLFLRTDGGEAAARYQDSAILAFDLAQLTPAAEPPPSPHA